MNTLVDLHPFREPDLGGRPLLECARCLFTSRDDRNLEVVDGLCNHCRRYEQNIDVRVQVSHPQPADALWEMAKRVRDAGKRSAYDCLIGLSGGTDSSYVAMLVKDIGLRPLAIHLDNGWNSELAVDNVARLLKHLDIDLITHVIDWDEFRDIQTAFLRASVPDGEVPSDHAINALMWKTADEWNIPFIISGMNYATEAAAVSDWAYGHSDWRYIKDVHAKHGRLPIETYPHFSLPYLAKVNVKGVRILSILNNIHYNKAQAKAELAAMGWRDYGGKHYESLYTRFYQGYVLPRKFGIDKRIAHTCDLINAGQMSRDEAIAELAEPPYPEVLQRADLEYVTKKLGLSTAEFDDIMAAPIRSFRDYKNSFEMVAKAKTAVNFARGRGLYPV